MKILSRTRPLDQSLVNGEIALEDAIAAFQKGMVLSKELQATLDKQKRLWLKSCKKMDQKANFYEQARKLALVESALRSFMETSN